MLIDEMRLYAEANDSSKAKDVNSTHKEKTSKKDFYEFDTDEESLQHVTQWRWRLSGI